MMTCREKMVIIFHKSQNLEVHIKDIWQLLKHNCFSNDTIIKLWHSDPQNVMEVQRVPKAMRQIIGRKVH